MRMFRRAVANSVVAALLGLAIHSMSVVPSYAQGISSGSRCITNASAGLGGLRGVIINGSCVPADASYTARPDSPPFRVIDCGNPAGGTHGASRNSLCPTAREDCVSTVKGKVVHADPMATQQQDPATGRWTTIAVWCPADATPVPTTAALRDQVLRLLPEVSIGSAPRADTLVRMQTILWADTPAARRLGTVTVVGQKVWLRIRFDRGTWTYGDGTTATSTGPGLPYGGGHTCDTRLCPDFLGHVYNRTGRVTVTLAVAWDAEYSLDGAHYDDVGTTPIVGPTMTTTLDVHEARSVLVRTPGHG